MNPIVGWSLGGPCVRPRPTSGTAWLGEPTWSPGQLLRDLELRLGFPQTEESAALRVPSWSRRLSAHIARAEQAPFYAKSYQVDALGTAKTLLAWRDGLIEAGWEGNVVPDAGERLATMAALEAETEKLPHGRADRLRALERELRAFPAISIYASLRLAEPRNLYSARWQAIFTQLEQRGTVIAPLTIEYPTPNATTDLGRLHWILRGEMIPPSPLLGDGSLLVLCSDTEGDLAELTAALLAKHGEGAVVVRCTDAGPLESALTHHGVPQQGHATTSAWRPAMQILPLALELAYEPRDPYRVLELLTLPIGPFQGRVGALLARAVSRQPGIGGTEWVRQKQKAEDWIKESERRRIVAEGGSELDAGIEAAANAAMRIDRIAEWLEAPGAPATGAARSALLAVVERVSTFLRKRMAFEDTRATYAAAYAQADAMGHALARTEQLTLTREEMRQLLDGVVRSTETVAFTTERAGRIDHVDHPGALFASARTVVFWNFVGGTERRVPSPVWQRTELRALAANNIIFPDPGALLAVEADTWRRGLLAAAERVILVIPRTLKGEPTAAHSTWDEIAARLGIDDDRAAAPITRLPTDLLAGRHAPLVPMTRQRPLRLPPARGTWTIPADLVGAKGALQTSPTALSELASCPLRFVLAHHAKVKAGALAKVASGPLLNGNLGHRLVEELHHEGAFADRDDVSFAARAERVLNALIRTEGATLLLEGASFERAQLVPQLVKAMRALRRYLVDNAWSIASVEEVVQTESSIGTLHGRLDVRLVKADGRQAVLDLKWGESSYRELLVEGRAIQLAAYVRAIHVTDGVRSLPPAAYFALGAGKVVTADARMSAEPLDGATLAETWLRVERTAVAVQSQLQKGHIAVAATRKALPLLAALEIAPEERPKYYALEDAEQACRYCQYDAICGKAWEDVQ